jgi:pyrimidine operon attenuation protein/uracil phosphoribosyltransferase
MQGAVARDAVFVGIYSGGAWLAGSRGGCRCASTGFIDVHCDDYAMSGLNQRAARVIRIDSDDRPRRRRALQGAASAARSRAIRFRTSTHQLAVLVDRGGRELPIEPTYRRGDRCPATCRSCHRAIGRTLSLAVDHGRVA